MKVLNFILGGLVAATLAACGNGGGSNNPGDGTVTPLGITLENIKGTWEGDTNYINGQPTQLSNVNNQKLQYEITDLNMRIIVSRNNQVVTTYSSRYSLQNTRLVTADENGTTMEDFDVIEVTSNSMKLRPLSQRGSGDLILSLRRISASEVVGGTDPGSGPGTNEGATINIEMRAGTRQASFNYSSAGDGSRSKLSCNYDSESQTLSLRLRPTVEQNRGGKGRAGAELYALGRHVNMDLSTDVEEQAFSILPLGGIEHADFSASYSPAPGKSSLDFLMTRQSRCNVKLNRSQDRLRFEGVCRDLNIQGDSVRSGAQVVFKGTCSLDVN